MMELKKWTNGEVIFKCESCTDWEELLRAASKEDIEFNDADFRNADFAGTNLSNLNLTGKKFLYADFSGANFETADISSSIFDRTNFRGAKFNDVKFTGTVFSGSSFVGADFGNASFESASFNRAIMDLVDFRYAIFKNANLTNVKNSKLRMRGLVGDMLLFKSMQIEDYFISYVGDQLAIGCQTHRLSEWENFSDSEIWIMDDGKSAEFWKKYKELIFQIIKTTNKDKK